MYGMTDDTQTILTMSYIQPTKWHLTQDLGGFPGTPETWIGNLTDMPVSVSQKQNLLLF